MFGDKRFTGVGYPTPVSFPTETTCLTVQVPASDEWWALITGLLYELTLEWNWQQFEGGMDRETAAGHWSDMVTAALDLAAANNECNSIVPAPYWDDTSGDDAPDEAPANDQRWYGRWDGETFLETVAYTFLTGFVATLVGEQAAIKFLTIPRAFRVLIRQNPHGANLLLFLDGGLYKVINGYSPFDQVAEFLIASPGTELMLVVDSTHDPSSTPNAHGDFVVDVIRTRLSESDVTNPNVRYYGTPPAFQTTYDGGTTWVDTPSSDVRHAAFASFPHLTPYDGVQCDTAARMAAQLKDAIELMCNVADAAQAVTGLLELILLPTGLVGALLSLFFTICDWIIDNGQATILAAFTDAVYDDIKCQLFCYISSDGSITQENLDFVWEKIKTAHPGTVATVIDEIRFLFTDVIFTNAGTQRTETGDCDACTCGWCQYFDFATGTHGWEVTPGEAGSWDGVKFAGAEFDGNSNTEIVIEISFSAADVNYVAFEYGHTAGSGGNNAVLARGFLSGSLVWTGTVVTNVGDFLNYAYTLAPTSTDRIQIIVNAGTSGGATAVYNAQIEGVNTSPFGANNC